MAMAGKRVLASAPYAAHYIVEGHDPIEARAKITTLRRIASESGREIANSVPVVVRMEGTNVAEGRKILADSGLNLTTAKDLADAAEKVAQLVK